MLWHTENETKQILFPAAAREVELRVKIKLMARETSSLLFRDVSFNNFWNFWRQSQAVALQIKEIELQQFLQFDVKSNLEQSEQFH